MMNTETETDLLTTLSKGASLHFIGKAIVNILGFLLHLILSQTLGAGLYGIYAYTRNVAGIVKVFTNMGSDNSILKYIPQFSNDTDSQQLFFGLSVVTSLICSLSAALVIAIFAPTISKLTIDAPEFVSVLRLFAVIIIFDTIARLFHSTFRGFERLEYQVFSAQIARPILRVSAVSIALGLGYSLFGAVIALTIASGSVLMISTYILITRFELWPWLSTEKVTKDNLFEYYNFSIPLTMKNAADILLNRIDIFMIGLFFSSSVVGFYNISVLIGSLIMLPLMGFNRLFPSIATRLYSNGDIDRLNSLYRTVTRWIFTIAFPMSIGAFIYRTEILSLFGDGFTAGTPVLAFFVTAQLFNSLGGPNGYLLMITERQYVLVINQWIFGVANVILNYAFITSFGFIGAAAATASILALLNIFQTIELWYFESLFPYSMQFWKPVFAGITMTVVLFGFQYLMNDLLLILIGGMAGLCIYFFTLFFLGVESEDRDFFEEIF